MQTGKRFVTRRYESTNVTNILSSLVSFCAHRTPTLIPSLISFYLIRSFKIYLDYECLSLEQGARRSHPLRQPGPVQDGIRTTAFLNQQHQLQLYWLSQLFILCSVLFDFNELPESPILENGVLANCAFILSRKFFLKFR